ncbi:MAG: HTH domain-containing protein [Eubacterium sp.]|jgi:predicted HTH transcriptional regulator|nr:HTH domain-containing protein [Eubacterium sp.]
MRVFKDVGLVEQLGSGMSRILRFYDKSIFEISDYFIKVVFPFSVPNENEIIANGDENRVLLLLEKEPNFTAKKISEQTGFSTRKISRIIKSLRETGKIIRVGSARKGYWKVNK